MHNSEATTSQPRRAWRRPGLAVQILALAGLLLIVLTLIINAVTVRQVGAATNAQAQTNVTGAANFFKYLLDQKGSATVIDGQLQFGGWIANNNFSIVDAVKDNTATEAVMYQLVDGKLVAIATTLQGADNKRATGAALTGPAADAAKRGDNYLGVNTVQGTNYFGAYTAIRDTSGKPVGLYFTGVPLAQLNQVQQRVTGTIIAVSLVVLLGGLALLLVLLSRLLIQPLGALDTAARRIGAGDYDVRVPVQAQNELGDVARTVNVMVERLTTTAREQAAQAQSLQRQIVQLLDEVSTVAEGDLTVEADVTADALGAVADSFNYMIGELRQIIGRVNQATHQVAASTDQILATTDNLHRSAEQQAARIADTSGAVEAMAESIQQVAENATISAQVARDARTAADAGAQAVSSTVAGMSRIRGQVQETSKKIKRLGESSQEIGQAVQLIEEIAKRTNRLALNAAIQAAMAGEHGKGFAVVAEEVRRLAERTGTATSQIADLVGAIQSETAQAVIAMEEGTREVVAGSRLADDAGQSLQAIDQIVSRLTELSAAISQAAEQQAYASAGIARAMGELSSVTQHNAAETEQAASSAAMLATLADDLRASVATFRLEADQPAGQPNGSDNGHNTAEAALVPAGAGSGVGVN
ncbi:MAG: methyl-accepting chemotaxis protein [Thermomicrobiales bacterium]